MNENFLNNIFVLFQPKHTDKEFLRPSHHCAPPVIVYVGWQASPFGYKRVPLSDNFEALMRIVGCIYQKCLSVYGKAAEEAVAKEKRERDIISQRIEQKAFEQQKSVGCNKVIGGI